MVKTLEQINAEYSHESTYDTFRVLFAWGVGKRGASETLHLIRYETVIEDLDPQPNHYKVGSVYSAASLCNGNGQHTARVVKGTDTNRITCKTCLKALKTTF